MRRLTKLLWRLSIAAALLIPWGAARAGDVTVFAAASLTDALQDIGKLYRETAGGALKFSFAASSTLARQIEAGAPAQIFVSADEKWMDYLAGKHLIGAGARKSPIGNSLVLIAPAGSKAATIVISQATDFAALLGPHGRLATGDPAHVPVGVYARQALEKLGVWRDVEPRLARTENVRASLALVERGEAPLGIVYATDAAVTKKVKVIGLFPAGSHTPIAYPFAIIAGHDKGEVRAAFDFITGPEGLKVFERYGFSRN